MNLMFLFPFISMVFYKLVVKLCVCVYTVAHANHPKQ